MTIKEELILALNEALKKIKQAFGESLSFMELAALVSVMEKTVAKTKASDQDIRIAVDMLETAYDLGGEIVCNPKDMDAGGTK